MNKGKVKQNTSMKRNNSKDNLMNHKLKDRTMRWEIKVGLMSIHKGVLIQFNLGY